MTYRPSWFSGQKGQKNLFIFLGLSLHQLLFGIMMHITFASAFGRFGKNCTSNWNYSILYKHSKRMENMIFCTFMKICKLYCFKYWQSINLQVHNVNIAITTYLCLLSECKLYIKMLDTNRCIKNMVTEQSALCSWYAFCIWFQHWRQAILLMGKILCEKLPF